MGRNDRSAESDKDLEDLRERLRGEILAWEGGRAIRRSDDQRTKWIDESPPDAHETHNEWNGVFDEVVV